MPKITRHGGFTDGAVVSGHVRVLLPAVVDPVQPIRQEDPWPGSSSETSPAKQPKSDEPAKPNRLKRARTTANPSSPTAASATAPEGTTSGPETDA